MAQIIVSNQYVDIRNDIDRIAIVSTIVSRYKKDTDLEIRNVRCFVVATVNFRRWISAYDEFP